MPKTWTYLFLTPDVDLNIPDDVWATYKRYGTSLRIPVTPEKLTYARQASHNEAYGIALGGMLQRNLPGLWTMSLDCYVPKDIFERSFHNRFEWFNTEWNQKFDWSEVYDHSNAKESDYVVRTSVLNKNSWRRKEDGNGEFFRVEIARYSQQNWIDYINLLMNNKQPLVLWDESNPKRISHMCKTWCITKFEYTMNPHDDIDYHIELIEWREPKVIIKDVVITTSTDEPTTTEEPPKVTTGDGKALLVFGSYDDRAIDKGAVYRPDIYAVHSGSGVYMRNQQDVETVIAAGKSVENTFQLKSVENKVSKIIEDVCRKKLPDGIEFDTVGVGQGSEKNIINVAFRVVNNTQSSQDISSLIFNSSDRQIRNAIENEVLSQINTEVQLAMKQRSSSGNTTRSYPNPDPMNWIVKADTSGDNGASKSTESSYRLWWDAWCDKLKVIKDIKDYSFDVDFSVKQMNPSYDGFKTYLMFTYTFTISHKAFTSNRGGTTVWYLVSPRSQRGSDDKVYEKSQSFLVPKTNTKEASYKEYLKTVGITYSNGTQRINNQTEGLNVERDYNEPKPIAPMSQQTGMRTN